MVHGDIPIEQVKLLLVLNSFKSIVEKALT